MKLTILLYLIWPYVTLCLSDLVLSYLIFRHQFCGCGAVFYIEKYDHVEVLTPDDCKPKPTPGMENDEIPPNEGGGPAEGGGGRDMWSAIPYGTRQIDMAQSLPTVLLLFSCSPYPVPYLVYTGNGAGEGNKIMIIITIMIMIMTMTKWRWRQR